MKNGRLIILLLAVFLILSCGDSKIEVQNTLLVLDTYPSNGAEINADLNKIMVFFSSAVDENSLTADSFKLELVGSVDIKSSGVAVNISIGNIPDDKSMVELIINETPLTNGAVYRLSIDSVKATNGAALAQKYYRFFVVKNK